MNNDEKQQKRSWWKLPLLGVVVVVAVGFSLFRRRTPVTVRDETNPKIKQRKSNIEDGL